MVEFKLDDSQLKQLEEHIKRVPEESERVINKVLKSKGSKEMIQAIVGFMPTSTISKSHAKSSNPIKTKFKNLGFDLVPKPKYSYLVFPNSGIGKRNTVQQKFFEKGADKSSNRILEMVTRELIKVNELGGK